MANGPERSWTHWSPDGDLALGLSRWECRGALGRAAGLVGLLGRSYLSSLPSGVSRPQQAWAGPAYLVLRRSQDVITGCEFSRPRRPLQPELAFVHFGSQARDGQEKERRGAVLGTLLEKLPPPRPRKLPSQAARTVSGFVSLKPQSELCA